MENKGKNKRDIIKNILIIFLIIMLLLTFFSNTMMNRSLPEVSTQYASYKQINDKIRASATVMANQDYSVVSDEAREISEVLIRRGDRVERGQVLFTLVENESSALSDAEAQLNSLLIEKQQKMMENVTEDEKDYDYEIGLKNEEIEEAKAELALVPEYESKLEALELEVETLEEALEEPTDMLEEIKAKMSALGAQTYDTPEELNAELEENKKLFDAAKKKYEAASSADGDYDAQTEALEAEQKSLTKEKKALNEKSSEYDELIAEATQKKSEYEEKMAITSSNNQNTLTLESQLNAIRSELQSVEREYGFYKEMKNAESYLGSISNNPDAAESEVAEAQRIYDEAKARYEDISDGSTRTEGDYLALIDSLELSEKDAEALYNDAASTIKSTANYETKIRSFEREIKQHEESKKEIENSIGKIDDRLAEITDEIAELGKSESKNETLKSEMDKAEEALELTERKLEYIKLSDEADALEKVIKAQNKVLEKKKDELTEFSKDAPEDAKTLEKQIKEAEKAIETYERQKSAAEKNEPYTDEIKRLELENLNDRIARQQKEIARIKNELVSTEITSPVSGTVTNVSYTAGEEIEAGATVATIAISDKGYTMEFSATNEQCQRIKIGDTVELQGYYYGIAPEVRVNAFKNDPSNPGRGKIVVLSVVGEDITVGQTLNFAIGDKTRRYDKVVPNSAVREDTNGKFVLVVESKSTPLGNRYTARRVEVDVITSDETSSALSGELLGGEFIITTSSAPVSDGMQVRLADKN